jgi:glycerophosphoryl diester phosphodiesterase
MNLGNFVVICLDSGDVPMTQRIIIAHRGTSAHAPENTILSFEKAWRFGADMIELDVHETADGHLVCIHDSTVDRTTNGTGEVDSLTLSEIQRFDAGMGQQIPLLEDVLKFSQGRIQVNIELKIAGLEERIANLVQDLDITDDIIISSFLHLSLSVIKEISEKIRIAILVQNEIANLPSYTNEISAYAINPAIELTSAMLITNSHELAIKVFPWTVNDEETMMRLLYVGVDGLITDYPDVGVNLVKTKFSS